LRFLQSTAVGTKDTHKIKTTDSLEMFYDTNRTIFAAIPKVKEDSVRRVKSCLHYSRTRAYLQHSARAQIELIENEKHWDSA